MIKYVVALAVFVLLIVGGFWLLRGMEGAADYKSATFEIEGTSVTLEKGFSETMNAQGAKTITQYFGNDAKGDLNGDSIPDLAFILTQNSGGSGTFFYVVAALQNSRGKYVGTNAILLGDRIAPQTTEIRNGILIVNYADRKAGEAMVTAPSVGTSKHIYYDGEKLVAPPPPGPITMQGTMVCLPHKNTEGPQTTECAYGLQDGEGRYFALSDTDPTYKNISSVPMNVRVEVKGAFKLRLGSNYQDIGIIEVTGITKL